MQTELQPLETVSLTGPAPRRTFSDKRKMEILKYAAEHGTNNALKTFKLAPAVIWRWKKDFKDKLLNSGNGYVDRARLPENQKSGLITNLKDAIATLKEDKTKLELRIKDLETQNQAIVSFCANKTLQVEKEKNDKIAEMNKIYVAQVDEWAKENDTLKQLLVKAWKH